MSAAPRRSLRRPLPIWCSWDMHPSEYVPSASATVEVEMAPIEASGPSADDVHAGYVDGNALAGPLSEVFAVDVTAATSQCATCGCTGPLARLHVYRHVPGLVARCQQCGNVMVRATRTRDSVWLDMSGVASLAIPLGGT
ncbi:DUF6510 family protein [Streptomyces sp. NPDC004074]|uniref:DUF6510 family protein n=2 Tax=unclassified Streptomyces TaxID=2593676 RepID=UPI0033A3A772